MDGYRSSIEDYQLGELLGKGGFASVVKAVHITKNSEVAIKMINKLSIKKTNMVQKVMDEAMIHYQLKHPSILQLFNCFEDDEYVYLVLEYCRHGELGRYLQSHNKTKLSEPEACTILRQVLDGLLYLHSHGILHRDLKLSNLLLDENNRIKIADFGLATKLNHPAETHVTMCGTPNYISPEVAAEAPHGLGVDVWGLGVLLYTLLLGYPPFQTGNIKSTLNKVVCENLTIPDGLSSEARDLLLRLLEKNPSRRITALAAARHPFFQMYPDTPLVCSGIYDSGLGPCSMCTCSRVDTSSANSLRRSRSHNAPSVRSSSIRSKGGGEQSVSSYCGINQNRQMTNSTSHEFSISAIRENSPFLHYNGSSSLPSPRLITKSKGFNSAHFNRNWSREDVCNPRSYNAAYSNHLEDTSGFVEGDVNQTDFTSRSDQPSRRKIDANLPKITTTRLPPTRLANGQFVFHILPSGDAVLEKPTALDTITYWTVTKEGYMAEERLRINSKKTPPIPGPNAEWHPVESLPRNFRRPYRVLASLVRNVQATTVKLTLHTEAASARLMESSPDDFIVDFITGETMEKHENVVTIHSPGGASQDCNFDNLNAECMPCYSSIAKTFAEVYKKCRHLERMLTEVSPTLFPASFGAARKRQSGKTEAREETSTRAQSTPVKSLNSRSRLLYNDDYLKVG